MRLAKTNAISRKLQDFTKLFRSPAKFVESCRFTLDKHKVLRISQSSSAIQVLSGVAWISVAGKDIILTSGEKAALALKKDAAVISALGNAPLIVEVS